MTSWEDERVRPFRDAKRSWLHRQRGWFIAEGPEVVRRLLEHGLRVVSVLTVARQLREVLEKVREPSERVPVYVMDAGTMARVAGYEVFQGLLVLACIPQERSAGKIEARRVVALDGISSAENVGVIVRNAAALGADTIWAGRGTASPWLRRAVRVSMGAVFALQVWEEVDLIERLAEARQAGMVCWASVVDPQAPSLWDCRLKDPFVLVVGAEKDGISQAVLEACDQRLRIPMAAGQDSLNVANALAVILAEAARQRALGGLMDQTNAPSWQADYGAAQVAHQW